MKRNCLKGLEIQPLTLAAYEQVYALWQQCPEGIGLGEVDSRAGIARYLERNPGMSFIAMAGGEVIGSVLCGHDGRRGYLHHLAVHPTARRRGVGRRLVESGLGALRQAGLEKCHLFIFHRNEAGSAFWKAMGWTGRGDIGVMSKGLVLGPEGPGCAGACAC